MTNPTAFPVANEGMTLRDYFAAKAMQAIIGEPQAVKALDDIDSQSVLSTLAIGSYRIADALLTERAALNLSNSAPNTAQLSTKTKIVS